MPMFALGFKCPAPPRGPETLRAELLGDLAAELLAGETVEEACMVHGVDADAFLVELNNYLAECEKSKEEAE